MDALVSAVLPPIKSQRPSGNNVRLCPGLATGAVSITGLKRDRSFAAGSAALTAPMIERHSSAAERARAMAPWMGLARFGFRLVTTPLLEIPSMQTKLMSETHSHAGCGRHRRRDPHRVRAGGQTGHRQRHGG